MVALTGGRQSGSTYQLTSLEGIFRFCLRNGKGVSISGTIVSFISHQRQICFLATMATMQLDCHANHGKMLGGKKSAGQEVKCRQQVYPALYSG